MIGEKRLCNLCKREVEKNILDENDSVCPYCGFYLRVHARKRVLSLADNNSFHEWDTNVKWKDFLTDCGHVYEKKLADIGAEYNLNDAIITGEMDVEGIHVAIGVMDTRFMMASMGYIVGEKITRLFEKATAKRLPVILFCCSGGVRVQEGIYALMQMGKTAIAVRKHNAQRLLYISILTNPTMGGVTASFATLADIIIAEKGAMIGFAGARIVEQNTGVVLPKEIQTAEFKLQHGLIDQIVERNEIKSNLGILIRLHQKQNQKIKDIRIGLDETKKYNAKCLSILDKIKHVRAYNRPNSKEFIDMLFDSFFEIKGDRVSEEDHTIIGGIAMFHGRPVTIIGQERGRSTLHDSIYRNWGMTSPSGYRKALRLMKQAEKFNRPIICFVDTLGAACGKEAEERGQASVIANMLREVSNISVPILSIIIGEAYSGGALALCIGNEVWMLENAIYSTISPEAFSSILWKNNTKLYESTRILQMEAAELRKEKIVDKIIDEDNMMDKNNMGTVCEKLEMEIIRFLNKYRKKSKKYIIQEKEKRFRRY